MSNRNSRQRARARLIMAADDRPRCSYCGVAISRKVKPNQGPVLMGGEQTWPFTIDHVIPKASGGPNAMANLIPACEPCNKARGNMPILDFVLQLGSRAVMSTSEATAAHQKAKASWEAMQCGG